METKRNFFDTVLTVLVTAYLVSVSGRYLGTVLTYCCMYSE